MTHESPHAKLLSLFLAMLTVTLAGTLVAAQTGQVIYQFKGHHHTLVDGAGPAAPLALAPDGTLYGTTSTGGAYLCEDQYGNFADCGTAFALKPPTGSGSHWGEQIIYDFGNPIGNGFFPSGSPLILDAVGNLYGTITWGGGENCGAPPWYGWPCGNVFQLAPPTSRGGAWAYNLLYTFQANSSDGYTPEAGLVFDKRGNLYGTTTEGGQPDGEGVGTVYELSPPASNGGPWTETILYGFQGSPDGAWPAANLVLDAKGDLFSTTAQGGTGSCGRGCGTIFELNPPTAQGQPWTETVLYSFQGGDDGWSPNGVILGKDGALYGTTQWGGNGSDCSDGGGCGTAFKLSPPSVKGAAWTETILYRFQGGTDGSYPVGNLVVDSQGRLYGTTSYGGSQGQNCSPVGCGTIFALLPQGNTWAEEVVYRFEHNAGGFSPEAGLTLGENGELYGTASAGGFGWDCGKETGLYICGTVFEIKK